MDTGRIKQFAIESRKILKEGVMQRIKALGFDEQGHTQDIPEKVQGGTRYQGRMIENERFFDSWIALNEHIQKVGVKAVYEEAAYTWFNRLIAIRIMQKNDFIEPVLSYDNPEIRVPHIVSEARRGHVMCALTDDEQNRLRTLLMDDTKTQDQFALLIIAYCRKNAVISKCFGGIAPYLELLLPDDILSQNRFIDLLNNTNEYITEEQFRSAELIGWLYQFYISERHDNVYNSFKKGCKAEAEDIPAATQIFTPNWIVKYMVQNTVGRIYLDNNPYCPLKKEWKYLVEPTEKTPKEAILNIDNLEDLTLADLACGSGHILVEGFDLLYSLYIDEGYSRYDAVKNIFTKNLTGIDLDTRAKQLATFALLLKGAQIDPKFLDGEIMPRVYDMPNIDRYTWRDLNGHMACALNIEMRDGNISKELDDAFDLMSQAQNLGSIMKFNISDATREFIIKCIEEQNKQHKFEDSFRVLFHGFNIILALTEKYAALAMNPPYMGSGNMNSLLSDYVKKNYEIGKADLFSVFMLLAIDRLDEKGKYGMINMQSWMFISAYEVLRRHILNNYHIDSLLHLGTRTFDEINGEIVSNAAFIMSQVSQNIFSNDSNNKGVYYNLENGINCSEKELLFLNAKGERGVLFTHVDQNNFHNIPGLSFGYWASQKLLSAFSESPISDYSETRIGLITGDNEHYIRNWYEVEFGKIEFKGSLDKKWYPQSKGGENRRWYGNNLTVLDWSNDGLELRTRLHESGKRILAHNFNLDKKFQTAITWTKISSKKFSARIQPEGFLFNDASANAFVDDNDVRLYLLAFLNTKIAIALLKVLNPTMNFLPGDISQLPVNILKKDSVNNLSIINTDISKSDWNVHETSWDFETSPLLEYSGCEIEEEGETVDIGPIPDLLEEQIKHYEAIWGRTESPVY